MNHVNKNIIKCTMQPDGYMFTHIIKKWFCVISNDKLQQRPAVKVIKKYYQSLK